MLLLESLVKSLMLFVRPFVAWLPTLLMAVLGGAYLYGVFEAALAPGRNFHFVYQGAQGPVEVRAESYAVLLDLRTIELNNLEVVSEADNGKINARKVRVKQTSQGFDIQVNDSKAALIRDEDGFLSALNLLPPSDDEAEPPVVNVTLDSLQLVFRDQMVQPVLTETLSLTDVRLVSSPGGLIAATRLSWPQVGAGDLTLELPASGGLSFVYKSDRTDLEKPLVWARRFLPPENLEILDPLRFQTAAFIGDVTGYLPDEEGEPPRFTAQGTLVADQASYDTYLDRAYLTADLVLAEDTLTLTADIAEPGRTSRFEGAVVLGENLQVHGEVDVRLANESRLWRDLRNALPPQTLADQIVYQGTISLQGETFATSGQVSADSLQYQQERVQGVVAQVKYAQDRLDLQIDQARYYDYPLSGWLGLDFKQDRLTGNIVGGSADLRPLLDAFSLERVRLQGLPQLLLSGNVSAPVVDASFTGFASIQTDSRIFDLGLADLRARFQEDDLVFQRAFLAGIHGVARLDGEIQGFGENLNLSFEAGDLDLSLLDPGLTGFSVALGNITGSIENPVITGEAAAFNVAYNDLTVPQAETQFRLEGQVLYVEDLVARLGLGRVVGAGTYDLETQVVSFEGAATDVFLSDYTDLEIFGQVDVPVLKVEGPLDALTAEAQLRARDILVFDVLVDQADLQATLSDDILQIQNLQANFGGGEVEATGTYNLQSRLALLTGEFAAVSLSAIPVDRSVIELLGTASGQFSYLNSPETQGGALTGTLQSFGANGFNVGPGQFNATLTGNLIEFDAIAGSPQGFASIESGVFELTTQELGGRFVASGLQIAELWSSVRDRTEDISADTKRLLDSLTGMATVEATVYGTLDDLSYGLEYLALTGLESAGQPLGQITGYGRADKDQIQLTNFQWQYEEGVLSGQGTWQTDGQVFGTIEAKEFDPQIINLLFPQAPAISADLNAQVNLSGTGQNPVAYGTFSLTNIVAPGSETPLLLTVTNGNLDFIDQTLTLTAQTQYDSVQGQINARLPLQALEADSDEQAFVTLTVPAQNLETLPLTDSVLDLTNSQAQLHGEITARGNLQDFNLEGGLYITGSGENETADLTIKGFETSFQDVLLSLTAQNKSVTLQGDAFSARGGYVNALATADLSGLLSLQPDQDALEAVQIQGRLEFDEFRVVQKIGFEETRAGQTVQITADQATEATVYGAVQFQGTAAEPVLSGKLDLGGLLVNLPPEFPASQGQGQPPVSPRFQNVQIEALPGSKINFGLGNLLITGVASINGSLSEPFVRAPLQVQGGTFNLPTTRIALQEGGTVDVLYGEAVGGAAVNLDLTGTTRVTVRETSTRYESYELQLNIRGDLLQPDGVMFSGQSDPPGLSDDQIRAIIGQQELIESLAAGVLGQQGPNSLTSSLYSLAVPNLTQGLTDSLARTLQLDYLVLDYNPFDLAVLRAGKTLARGLRLEGSRQLTPTQFEPVKWELQLTYRLPSSDRILSRTQLILGTNETVPWRFGLNYSVRF